MRSSYCVLGVFGRAEKGMACNYDCRSCFDKAARPSRVGEMAGAVAQRMVVTTAYTSTRLSESSHPGCRLPEASMSMSSCGYSHSFFFSVHTYTHWHINTCEGIATSGNEELRVWGKHCQSCLGWLGRQLRWDPPVWRMAERRGSVSLALARINRP